MIATANFFIDYSLLFVRGDFRRRDGENRGDAPVAASGAGEATKAARRRSIVEVPPLLEMPRSKRLDRCEIRRLHANSIARMRIRNPRTNGRGELFFNRPGNSETIDPLVPPRRPIVLRRLRFGSKADDYRPEKATSDAKKAARSG
jgi:hypothetical protein